MAHVAPSVTVEIALTTAPFATPSWTDVTAYVDQLNYPIQIERGRDDAQSAAQPGTCTFVLNNDDKRFTPGYTGGTYGSNVKIGKRVRVTVTHNGTDYRRFSGYISSFDMQWPTGVTQQNRPGHRYRHSRDDGAGQAPQPCHAHLCGVGSGGVVAVG